MKLPGTRARYEAIVEAVLAIPAGRVASYGQVAAWAGLPRRARLVGRVLRELPESSSVPWHRVLGAQGRISFPREDPRHHLQRALLEAEGIRFVRERVDLDRHRWGGCGP